MERGEGMRDILDEFFDCISNEIDDIAFDSEQIDEEEMEDIILSEPLEVEYEGYYFK